MRVNINLENSFDNVLDGHGPGSDISNYMSAPGQGVIDNNDANSFINNIQNGGDLGPGGGPPGPPEEEGGKFQDFGPLGEPQQVHQGKGFNPFSMDLPGPGGPVGGGPEGPGGPGGPEAEAREIDRGAGAEEEEAKMQGSMPGEISNGDPAGLPPQAAAGFMNLPADMSSSMTNNLAAMDKANIQGDSEVGKS